MRLVLLLLLSMGFLLPCRAQYVYSIKADSVKVTGANCDSSEFILQNHTRNVPGFLFNTGQGRTVFQRALQKINDSLYLVGPDSLRLPGDTIRLLYGGLGISPGYIGGRDTLVLKTVRGGPGIIVNTLVDSSLLFSSDSTAMTTTGRLYKVIDSLGALIGSGSVTQIIGGYGLWGGTITSTGTLTVDTGAMATTALLRKVADSAAAAARPPIGFNVEFVYGSGGSGLPKKNTDSVYSNPGLVSNNVQVYVTGSSTSMMLTDSLTWALTGQNPLTPYFRYNKGAGKLTFCNFGNVSGLANGAFVVSVFAGPQGYPGLIDTGGGTLLPPVVNAGGNQTITIPASSATLSGTASSPNPGGSITSSLWAFVSGPMTPTISTPNSIATAVTNMDSVGNYLFSLTATDNGGRQTTAETQITVSNGEALSISPSSLGSFTTYQDWMSAAQKLTISGTHLGTNTVTVVAPTNYLVSQDSINWYQSLTFTPSGGNLLTSVYLAISANASAGAVGGYVVVAANGASTQQIAVSGTVNASPNNIARFNFSSVASSVNGWTNIYGNPLNVIKGTNIATGWTLTDSGMTANWQNYSGFFGDGTDTAGLMVDSAYSVQFPSDVWHSGDLYNYSVPYNNGNYGFKFTNLPAGTYTIQIMGRIPRTQNFSDAATIYHMQFGTGTDQSARLVVQNNYDQFATFTGTITAGQTIQFGLYQDNLNNGKLGWITALIITRN